MLQSHQLFLFYNQSATFDNLQLSEIVIGFISGIANINNNVSIHLTIDPLM